MTNLQLELLKTFSYDLNGEELLDIKAMLANYFAQRAIQKADEAWEEKGRTDKDVDQLLETKLRKSK
ncbi:MAG: hypothetical protein AAFP19_08055 [Bacteroidota bacterium]